LPSTANWDTPLLIEHHKIFSGLWNISKIDPERRTVYCIPGGDSALTVEEPRAPFYPFIVSRSISAGLIISSIADAEVSESKVKPTPKVSVAPPLTLRVRGSILSINKVDTVEQTFESDVFFECRLCHISTIDDLPAVETVLLIYGLHGTPTPVINLLSNDINLESWISFGPSSQEHMYDYTFKYRGKGVFAEEFELQRFPFDEQFLNISMSVLKSRHLVTLQANEQYPSTFVCSNFQMGNIYAVAYEDLVLTTKTFSNAKESASGLVYPRFAFSILLVRKPMYYITNIAIPMMVLTYLAFLSFAVSFDGSRLDTSDRLSITLTLLLTAVAYKFVVASAIPQVSYLTLLDQYISFCFGFICIIMIENAIYPYLETRRGWNIGRKEENYVFYVLIGLFTVINAIWLIWTWRMLADRKKRLRAVGKMERKRRELAQSRGPKFADDRVELLSEYMQKEEGLDLRNDCELLRLLGENDLAQSVATAKVKRPYRLAAQSSLKEL
jgi:hypothetical protein